MAKKIDQQSLAFQTSMKMAVQYEKAVHGLLLNMKLAQSELEVRPPQKEGKDHS